MRSQSSHWSEARVRLLPSQVHAAREYIQRLSNAELRQVSASLCEEVAAAQPVDPLLPKAVALACEMADRIGYDRISDQEILGGCALYGGKFVESPERLNPITSIILAAYISVIAGKNPHIALADDKAVSRATAAAGPLYRAMGITCGVISTGSDRESRREEYKKEVLLAPYQELATDYLHDNLAWEPGEVAQNDHNVIIVNGLDLLWTGMLESREINYQEDGYLARLGPLPALPKKFRRGLHYLLPKAGSHPSHISITTIGERKLNSKLGAIDYLQRFDIIRDLKVAIYREHSSEADHSDVRGDCPALEQEGVDSTNRQQLAAATMIDAYYRTYEKMSAIGPPSAARPSLSFLCEVFGLESFNIADVEVSDVAGSANHVDQEARKATERALWERLSFDQVLERQQIEVYRSRKLLVYANDVHELVMQIVAEHFDKLKSSSTPHPATTRSSLVRQIEELESQFGTAAAREIERRALLSVVDKQWREHLRRMRFLYSSTSPPLHGYAGSLLDYQKEASRLYSAMLSELAPGIIEAIENLAI